MKRRGLTLLIALGVGGGLVGLAAVLVRVTRVHDFYAVCLVIGLIAIGRGGCRLVSRIGIVDVQRGARTPTTTPSAGRQSVASVMPTLPMI